MHQAYLVYCISVRDYDLATENELGLFFDQNEMLRKHTIILTLFQPYAALLA